MWTSYNENGSLTVFDKPKEPIIYEIVEDTLPDYEVPNNATIKNGAVDVIKDEAQRSLSFIDEVGTGIANGIRAAAKTSKYLPYLILIAAALFIFKKLGVVKA